MFGRHDLLIIAQSGNVLGIPAHIPGSSSLTRSVRRAAATFKSPSRKLP